MRHFIGFIPIFALTIIAFGQEAKQKPAKDAAAPAVKLLNADELKDLRAGDGKDFLYLDVREPRELEELGALKGSVNIPLGELEKRLSEIPKDKTIVPICTRGIRAARAAAILQKNGYHVAAVSGLKEWKEKSYELVYPKAGGGK